MDGFARSTIAALFYAQPDRIAFADLVSELASSLLHTAAGGLDIHTAYDDFVVFDLADKRICLAHSDLAIDFPEVASRHRCSQAVLVSVGDKPDAAATAGDQLALCEGLAGRIETRAPAEGSIFVESDTSLTEDSFDAVLEDILAAFWETPVADAAPSRLGESDPAAQPSLPMEVECRLFAPARVYGAAAQAVADTFILLPKPPEPLRAEEALSATPGYVPTFDRYLPRELVDGLAARFDREMAARAAQRAKPPLPARTHRASAPLLFPTTTFGEPRPAPPPRTTRAASAFARIRRQARPAKADEGLFPPTQVARSMPLVHRGAIQALNVATLAFSLPIGAFLLILAVLGRESLVMSSRMTAVTGAGMGIAQHDSVASLVTALF